MCWPKRLSLAGRSALTSLTAEVARTVDLVQPLRLGNIDQATDDAPDIAGGGVVLVGRQRRRLLGHSTPIVGNLPRPGKAFPMRTSSVQREGCWSVLLSPQSCGVQSDLLAGT